MNKVVLVTGSSRGIGKAIVTDFAEKGYNVVINYRKEENEANKLREELENKHNIQAITIKADVSNEDEEFKKIAKEIIKISVEVLCQFLKIMLFGFFLHY